MKRLAVFLLLLPLVACDSTKSRVDPDNPDGEISIQADELEPMRRFVLETRRVVAAEFVKIDISQQFFEQNMSYTRDPQFVKRTPVRILEDGTKVIELTNANSEQKTNIDPDLLPRVNFGRNGLEIRAYRTIVIFIRPTRNRERPLFLRVQAKGAGTDVKMWVGGRLHHEKPALMIESALIWNETFEEYDHLSSVG